jgi:hypothetical protein
MTGSHLRLAKYRHLLLDLTCRDVLEVRSLVWLRYLTSALIPVRCPSTLRLLCRMHSKTQTLLVMASQMRSPTPTM